MNAAERSYVAARAYVPEHLTAYVAAITGGRPHLIGDCVAYTGDDRLIFVGYPLNGCPELVGAGRLRNGSSDFQSPDAAAAWQTALDAALTRFRPRLISVTAARLPPSLGACAPSPPDAYYRLDLAAVQPDKKLRNLLRRAGREVSVGQVPALRPEHHRLVDESLAALPVDAGTRYIFERLGRYGGPKGIRQRIESAFRVQTGRGRARMNAEERTYPRLSALVRVLHLDQEATTPAVGRPYILEARDAAGRLVAFDIAAFGGEVAFYLFNFRSRQCYVPGASDLLLARLIAEGQARGKHTLNLGLGINPGVSRFKEKWGAEPFLSHVTCTWERPASAWEDAVGGL